MVSVSCCPSTISGTGADVWAHTYLTSFLQMSVTTCNIHVLVDLKTYEIFEYQYMVDTSPSTDVMNIACGQ